MQQVQQDFPLTIAEYLWMGHDWQLFRNSLLEMSSKSYTLEDNTAIRVVFYILYFNEPILTSLQYTFTKSEHLQYYFINTSRQLIHLLHKA